MTSLREIMDLVSRPEVLSLAIGLPAADLFPREALAKEAAQVLRTDPSSLQYSLPYRPLKTQIVQLMAMRGVRCTEEQIFLTSGAQQGMDLLTRLLVKPRRPVVIEWAVYDGIQLAARQHSSEILTVASDPIRGIDLDELVALLDRGVCPAYIYVIPNGHNPLGASMSVESRHRLAELARRYRVPVVEDDVYGFLYYDETPVPPLRAFEEEWIFYLGSFSKILGPSLRAGWIVAPAQLTALLSPLKHAVDLDTPSFSHHMIAAYLEAGHLPSHLAVLRAEYRRRRDAILSALQTHVPPEVRWNHPTSGMFVWAELPSALDATELLRVAVETENVAFSPGTTFCSGDPRGSRCLRLSFTNHPPGRLEEAIRRLGRVIGRQMARSSAVG